MSLNGLFNTQFPLTIDGTTSLDASSITIDGQNIDLSNLVPYTGSNQTVDLGSQIIKTTHTAITNPELINKGQVDGIIANLSVAIQGTFLDKVTVVPQTVLGAVSFSSDVALSAQTASRVLILDASKNITSSSVSTTTLGFLDPTSSIQNQLNSKANLTGGNSFTGSQNYTDKTASTVAIFDTSTNLVSSAVSTTELNHVGGTTSNIQTQLNNKLNLNGSNANQNISIGAFKVQSTATPTVNSDYTTKKYVDDEILGAGSLYLLKTGGNANQNINISGFKVQSSATPTLPQDYTTKGYVDSQDSAQDAVISALSSLIALKANLVGPNTFSNTHTFTSPFPINLSGLTADRVVVLDSFNNLITSSVSTTTLGFLDPTSSVQNQLNSKLNLSGGTITGDLTVNGTTTIGTRLLGTPDTNPGNFWLGLKGSGTEIQRLAIAIVGDQTVGEVTRVDIAKPFRLSNPTADRVLTVNGTGDVVSSSVTPATLAFMDATSSVQNQLNSKLNLSGGNMTGSINFPIGQEISWGALKFSRILDDFQLRICTDDELTFNLGADSTTTGIVKMRLDFQGVRVMDNFICDSNIGIGVTPLSKLHILSSGVQQARFQTSHTDNHYLTASHDLFSLSANLDLTSIIPNPGRGSAQITLNTPASAGFIQFLTGSAVNSFPVERMRITGTGHVGIGTNNPLCPLYNFGLGTGGWKGQSYFGNETTGVILGTFNNVAYLGGHSSALNAWTDIAIAPVGNVGNVGFGTSSPSNNKVDIHKDVRTGTHATGCALYVTKDSGDISNGIAEFRISNGTQGIGIGFNGIYATGSNTNQDLRLTSRGTGSINLLNNTGVVGNLIVSGTDGITLNGSGTSVGVLTSRYYISFRGDNQDDIGNDNIYGPWYGLGQSGITGFINKPCLAGYYGCALRSGLGFMVLDENGRVGIGTTNAVTALHIARSFSTNGDYSGMISFENTTVGFFEWQLGPQVIDGQAVFSLRGGSDGFGGLTNYINVSGAGNVGIGTTNPASTLDVLVSARSGTHGTGCAIYATKDAGDISNGIAEFRHSNGTQGIGIGFNGIYATGINTNQDLQFSARGTGILRLLNDTRCNGIVGIGEEPLAGVQLRLANSVVNRKIVLYTDTTNEHQFYGFGINGGTLRFNVEGSFARFGFFVGTSASSSSEVVAITGTGSIETGVTSNIVPNLKLASSASHIDNNPGEVLLFTGFQGHVAIGRNTVRNATTANLCLGVAGTEESQIISRKTDDSGVMPLSFSSSKYSFVTGNDTDINFITYDLRGQTSFDGSNFINLQCQASQFGRNQLILTGRYEGLNDAFSFTTPRNAIRFRTQSSLNSAYTDRWTIQNFDDALGFLSSNTPTMVLRGSNVGIGTTNPQSLVHLNSVGTHQMRFQTSSVDNQFITASNDGFIFNANLSLINVPNAGRGSAQLILQTPTAGGIIQFLTGNAINTVPSERMRITGAGNVGIGTTTPSTPFHLVGNMTINSGNIGGNGLNNLRWGRTNDVRAGFAPNGQEGATAGWYFGTYTNNDVTPYADLLCLNSWTDSSGGLVNLIAYNKGAKGIRQYQGTFGSSSAFSTYYDAVQTDGNSPNVSISGRLAVLANRFSVGETAPRTLMTVTGGDNGAATSRFGNVSSWPDNANGCLYSQDANTDANSGGLFVGYNGADFNSYITSLAPNVSWLNLRIFADETEVFRQGTLVAITTSGGWNNISDQREKEDIQPLKTDHSLERVLALKPKHYRRKYSESVATPVPQKEKDKRLVGFIAQEVLNTNPHCLGEWCNDEAKNDQTDDDGQRYSMSYNDYIVHLVGAVQEQQKQIGDLQHHVKVLEERETVWVKHAREQEAKMEKMAKDMEKMAGLLAQLLSK